MVTGPRRRAPQVPGPGALSRAGERIHQPQEGLLLLAQAYKPTILTVRSVAGGFDDLDGEFAGVGCLAFWESAIVRRLAMAPSLDTQPASRQAPLSAEEKARGAANFALVVAEHLATNGRFRVSADTAEMVELFQRVARRVGDRLKRPVVSYANGRYLVITFGREPTEGPTGPGVNAVQQ